MILLYYNVNLPIDAGPSRKSPGNYLGHQFTRTKFNAGRHNHLVDGDK